MNTFDAIIKEQNKGIVKTALAQMIEDGWNFGNNTVENMNEYFELSLKHLVNVFDGEDVIQDEHLGFMIDFITTVKEIE